MAMYLDQYAERSHCMEINNSSFERVEELKYLERNLKHQNSIQEEIKNRLKSGKACYVFQFAIQKFKDKNIQEYNFARCFLLVRKLVTHIKGGT